DFRRLVAGLFDRVFPADPVQAVRPDDCRVPRGTIRGVAERVRRQGLSVVGILEMVRTTQPPEWTASLGSHNPRPVGGRRCPDVKGRGGAARGAVAAGWLVGS